MPAAAPLRILFVCLGNICRSPLAEGAFRRAVEEAGLAERFVIDSAGTGHWHVGAPPDERMRQTARRHGLSLDDQRGRQFTAADFDRFDHIFAMDKDNLHDILFLDADGAHAHKVRLFREADPTPGDYQVPDPYYGGNQGFENVYAIADRTARALLAHFVEEYGLV